MGERGGGESLRVKCWQTIVQKTTESDSDPQVRSIEKDSEK